MTVVVDVGAQNLERGDEHDYLKYVYLGRQSQRHRRGSMAPTEAQINMRPASPAQGCALVRCDNMPGFGPLISHYPTPESCWTGGNGPPQIAYPSQEVGRGCVRTGAADAAMPD
jgi:hypothetical protein